jgi:catechol 2,3-dioxygenase-like lactoylglutathione lyase family enzyme
MLASDATPPRQGKPMSLGITGIDHVQIAVPKALEADCLKFYREVFAFPELEKPPELRARGGAWFQVGNIQMHIGVDPEASPKSKRHICFLTSDLAKAKTYVRSKGVAIEEESVAEGLARFFVRDPAGNRIEIGQR